MLGVRFLKSRRFLSVSALSRWLCKGQSVLFGTDVIGNGRMWVAFRTHIITAGLEFVCVCLALISIDIENVRWT